MKEPDKYNYVINCIKKKANEILPSGSSVILFGSRARGDARIDSDWDLLILIPGPQKISWETKWEYSLPFDDMGLEINEEINPIVYSFEEWKTKTFLLLYYNIREEGIKIYDVNT